MAKPDYPKAIWQSASSENYGNRPASAQIDAIVLHATAGGLSGTLAWFANPKSGVSAHYVAAKNGDMYQMVEEKRLAHHAGSSNFQGRQNWNNFSIGIEIVNLNDGQDPYPPEQFEAMVDLVSYLVAKYNIQREWIVTHAEISTVGKTDPRGFAVHELIQRVYDQAIEVPENVVRTEAWEALGVPFNPNFAFPRYANEQNLGVPLTEEFDFSYRGVNYRGQGFAQAILYCQVGDWGNIKEMKW
ncbi:MAG: N-acetylmuramoyl-L-alanine amidase [Anaerolineae bacterium]